MKKPRVPKAGPKKALKEIPPKSTKFDDKEKREIARKICEDYSSGEFTIDSCCRQHGISYRSFQNWCDLDSEIYDAFKKAKISSSTKGRDWLKEKALDSMQRLITGFWIEEPEEEVTEITNKAGVVVQTIRRRKTKKKYFAPVVAAVIYSLKNIDPDNWNKSEPTNQEEDLKQVWKIGDQIVRF